MVASGKRPTASKKAPKKAVPTFEEVTGTTDEDKAGIVALGANKGLGRSNRTRRSAQK